MENARPVMRGSLLLKDRSVGFRGIRPWLKRFFVLSVKYIGVYKRESDVKKGISPINVWPCQDVLKVEYFPDKRLGCRFNISLKEDLEIQVLELDGPNIKEARRWVRKVKLCKEMAIAVLQEDNKLTHNQQNKQNSRKEEIAKRARQKKVDDDEEIRRNNDEPEPEEIPSLPLDFGLTRLSENNVPESISNCLMVDAPPPPPTNDDEGGVGVGIGSDSDEEEPNAMDEGVAATAAPAPPAAPPAFKRAESDIRFMKCMQLRTDPILDALMILDMQRFHTNFVQEEYLFEDLVHISDEELLALVPEAVPRSIFGAYLMGQGRVAKQPDGYGKEAKALKASITALQDRLSEVANKFAAIDCT